MPRQRIKNRNRKKHVSQKNVIPIPLTLVLLLVGTLAVSYLWLCGRTDALGLEIQRLENKISSVVREIRNEEYKWSMMISPQHIQETLNRHKIKMQWPKENQVVHIYNMDLYPKEQQIDENQNVEAQGSTRAL